MQPQQPSGTSAAAAATRRISSIKRSRNNRSRNLNRSRRSGLRRRDVSDARGYQGLSHPPGVAPRASVTPRPLPAPAQASATPEPVATPVSPMKFFCQLAHGGPTAIIETPNNLSEVYQAIASKYDGMSADEILYCTVNTFKPEMDHLLTTNLKLNDFIFAHVRGTRKEVTLIKDDAMLGVTLTDNGSGKVFIKRIHNDSVAARSQPAVCVGDHIEKVNGESVVGSRHFNVAAMLRAIPVGESFTLRLIEPQRSGFSFVAPRSGTAAAASSSSKKAETLEDGNKTLRFRAQGNAVLQEAPSKAVVEKINDIFETYLGFNDDVLALAGWDIASKAKTYVELKDLFTDSDLGGFGFPDELLFDIWGAVDDYRKNRIPVADESEATQLSAPPSTSAAADFDMDVEDSADCKTD